MKYISGFLGGSEVTSVVMNTINRCFKPVASQERLIQTAGKYCTINSVDF